MKTPAQIAARIINIKAEQDITPELIAELHALQWVLHQDGKLSDQEKQQLIIEAVCINFGITVNRLLMNNKRRNRKYAEIRQIIMYMLKNNTNLSFNDIGLPFRKYHSTVLYSIKTVENIGKTNKCYQEELRNIQNLIDFAIDKHTD